MSTPGVTLGRGSYVVGGVVTNLFGVAVNVGQYCSISQQLNILGYDHACMFNRDIVSTWPFDCWWGLPSFPNVLGVGGVGDKGRRSIQVGNDVWIAQNVFLRPGVMIGDGAIIGGCAVIMKDVPPYAIVSGNPQTIIRYRFTKQQIEKLLKIKWWDWSEEKIKENVPLFGNIEEFIKKFS